MKCQFCRVIVAEDELQSHQVSSCPAIENVNFDGITHQCVEIMLKWTSCNENTVGSNVPVLLSDREDQIELNKQCDGSFQSEKLNMQMGNYVGQLIVGGGSEMFPLKTINVNSDTHNIFLELQSKEPAISMDSTTNKQLIPLVKDGLARVDDERDVSVNVRQVAYTLNKHTTIDKKIESCSRRPYDFKMCNGTYVGKLSTAAFELFRADVDKYLKGNNQYISKTTVTRDGAGNITQDKAKVRKNPDNEEIDFDKIRSLYTIHYGRSIYCHSIFGSINIR